MIILYKLFIEITENVLYRDIYRYRDKELPISGYELVSLTSTVKTLLDGASHQLQDCFERTCWDIFEHPDLEVFTDSVLCYIKNCIDIVTLDKRIQVYPNKKPWMTSDQVMGLCTAQHAPISRGASERPRRTTGGGWRTTWTATAGRWCRESSTSPTTRPTLRLLKEMSRWRRTLC